MSIFSNFSEILITSSISLDQLDAKKETAEWQNTPNLFRLSLADPFLNVFNLFFTNRDNIKLKWRYDPKIKFVEFAVAVRSNGKLKVYDRADQVLRTAAGTKTSLRVRRDNRRQYRVALYLESQGPDSVNEFVIPTRKRFTLYRTKGECIVRK